MREYRQLTEEDRIEIYAMKQAGKEQNKIAVKLGVHPSTISRELASIDGYVQGFPQTTFLKPTPLPSEKLHIERA